MIRKTILLSLVRKRRSIDIVFIFQTYSVDRTVPDSACTATALFGGVKTNAEVTGLDGSVTVKDCLSSLNEDKKVSSIMDWAQDVGKDTGTFYIYHRIKSIRENY